MNVKNTNVYESIRLGEQQHRKFQASWHDEFYNAIKKEFKTIKFRKSAQNLERFKSSIQS